MAIVVTFDGLKYLAGVMLRDPAAPPDWNLHLYQNNYTPLQTSLVGDFAEATFAGYAPKTLTRADWSAPSIVGVAAQSIYADAYQQWLATLGTQTVYGQYVTDDSDSVVLWAERFPTPITVSDTVPAAVLPVIRLRAL